MALTLATYAEFATALPTLSSISSLPGVSIEYLPGRRVFRCDTGEHRYHRSKARAQACAFAALPMVRVQ